MIRAFTKDTIITKRNPNLKMTHRARMREVWEEATFPTNMFILKDREFSLTVKRTV